MNKREIEQEIRRRVREYEKELRELVIRCEECKEFTFRRRYDQKYCSEKCSKLVTSRTWWRKNGADWRVKRAG